MSGSMDLDRQLTARLAERFEARATSREPDGLLDSALARVATTRQRPRWRAVERWTPMTTLTMPARPTIRVAWLVALLLMILALLAALLVQTGHQGLPSNGRILIGQNGSIFQLNTDGTTTDLLQGGDPASGVTWSPDGRRAAFWRTTSDGATLWTLPANGSPAAVPTSRTFHPTFGEAEILTFSPDGKRIAFASTPSAPPTQGPSSIYVVDLDAGATTELPHPGLSAADTPSFSHDGKKIAFRGQLDDSSTGHRLYVVNADGTGQRRLTDTLADRFDAVNDGVPVWSPDDRSILIDGANNDGRSTAFRLYRVDAASGDASRLTTQPMNGYAPSYAPDGSLIAFTDWQDPVSSLWVMRPDGTDKLRLDNHTVSVSDQWSPDGKWILYEGQPASGHNNSLYEIHPDGSGRQVLQDVPSAANPRSGLSWQPVR